MHQQLQPAADLRSLLDHNTLIGEPRRGARRFWTTREEKLLNQHYPSGGVEACLAYLPGRSAAAIYNHAGMLGLHAPAKQKHDFRRQRWTSSDYIDAVIRRTYQRTPTKGDIDALAAAVSRPRWWVTKRASKLGLVTPRFKEPAWSEAERDIVHDNFHRSARTSSVCSSVPDLSARKLQSLSWASAWARPAKIPTTSRPTASRH